MSWKQNKNWRKLIGKYSNIDFEKMHYNNIFKKNILEKNIRNH